MPPSRAIPTPGRLLLCVLSVSVLGACAGSRASSSQSKTDPCADFEVEVERVWSASVRAEFMKQSAALEVERRQAVANEMDLIAEDWVRTRTSVCRDHFVRGIIDAETYAARVRCFDDRLERQRSSSELLRAAGDAADLALVEASLDELLAQPPSCAQPTQAD
ncbi:hypothetical protein G6O69_09235 [Pseudenhygromyxa sp. WMMC2535]|uniref:hypothetical protein n=1 Tax=Pseudenhygromyxa sp. WMMC2535 TaxID=2712867 RepID=UPI0015524B8F|nr:hypothetical protein [Pseudenhygromyxa sp. WMMC2535]NVB38014.1 hypothetical protein [Pseudenhygromyxa sp. WMMC2535]